eukprot:317403-Chlamydomonas_euryale.AAC.1
MPTKETKIDEAFLFDYKKYNPPKDRPGRRADQTRKARVEAQVKAREDFSGDLALRKAMQGSKGKSQLVKDNTFDDWRMQPPIKYTKHAKLM